MANVAFVLLLALSELALGTANISGPSWYKEPYPGAPPPAAIPATPLVPGASDGAPGGRAVSPGGETPVAGDAEPEHDEHWHKPLFPLDWTDIVGFICASMGLVIAAGGGIGGGGMLVPIYILVMRFTPKYAIPLSNVTVFGGAVMNYVMNLSKRHPTADRPLVDWDLILVMQPMTIAGALLGGFVNKLLPDLILTIALVLLLSYTTQTTLVKGFTVYNKETEQQKAKAAAKESELSKLHAEEQKDGVAETEALLEDAEAQDTPAVNPELEAILEDEKSVPSWKIGAMWAIFSVVIFVNLLKGGGGFASPVGITCGSQGYWVSTGFMFVWILLVSYYLRGYLLSMSAKKRRLFYRYAEGDIEWDEKATIIYPVVCILAGLCAGMFGIGGGIVQVPLMLKIGINPKVASATSATMIMYTSFTAMTSFYVFGLLKMDYAVICLILGLCVTFVGQIGLTILIKKLGRDSLIIFSVAAVVGVSAVLMGTHSIIQLASAPSLSGGGGAICAKGD